MAKYITKGGKHYGTVDDVVARIEALEAENAMLRACKTADATDHAEKQAYIEGTQSGWDAAIEAAADKLRIMGDMGGMEIVLSLKKGSPNDRPR